MKVENKIFKYWLPPALWATLIFLLSSLQTAQTSKIFWQDFVIKKTAHVIEYGVLALLLYRALKEGGVEKKKAGFYSILVAIIYAITDEYHQSFTPGREPRVRDILFDTIGASLAIWGIWSLLPKAPKRLRNLAKDWELL